MYKSRSGSAKGIAPTLYCYRCLDSLRSLDMTEKGRSLDMTEKGRAIDMTEKGRAIDMTKKARDRYDSGGR